MSPGLASLALSCYNASLGDVAANHQVVGYTARYVRPVEAMAAQYAAMG